MAGIAIGIGGTVYLSMDDKLAGALLFTVGLYTICVHKLNLFTGKVGYCVEQPISYLCDLAVIWLGNLAGAACAAFAILQTRIGGIGDKAVTLCEAKCSDRLLSLFLLAVFCGFLMFVAVDGYKSSQNPILLFVCVSAFILCGFEHCIADMFYFSLANAWSAQTFLDILVITLGNSAGAVLIPLAMKLSA